MEKTVTKIAIIGAESTGKTYTCKHLAKKYKTVFVKEYAREYLNKLNSGYKYSDLEKIARYQIREEEEAINKKPQIIFFDTSILTIKIWSNFKYKKCSDFIIKACEKRKYDFYIICNNDIKRTHDPLRESKNIRHKIFNKNIEEVEKENFSILRGTGLKRLKMAEKICEDFLKSKKQPIIN